MVLAIGDVEAKQALDVDEEFGVGDGSEGVVKVR